MQITDMNLICLEECLEHLNLGDLLRVADSNNRLRIAAEFVFTQKYGEKEFHVYFCENSFQIYRIKENHVSVYDLKFFLRLLRCFGHLIASLAHERFDKYPLAITYTSEYCAKSLAKIKLRSTKETALKQMTGPFVNVNAVTIENCHITQTGWLKNAFPNMQNLRYSPEEYQINSIADHFPQLERLDIVCRYFSTDNTILECLHFNPQLKILRLHGFSNSKSVFSVDSFRTIIESMENLEQLELSGQFARFSNATGKKIHSKSIKKFVLHQEKEIYGKYPYSFDRLESFEFWGYHMNDCYEFIDQHPTITKIKILNSININVNRLIKALPLLTQISLEFVPVSFVDVVGLVSDLKLLQSISFRYCSLQNYVDELRARFADEWQMLTCDQHEFCLNRRNKIQ